MMPGNSPILLLLDGILSQDEQSITSALQQIEALVPSLGPLVGDGRNTPLHSASALERIVHGLLLRHPHLAQITSGHDGSLPLHFAASIGNVRVAGLLLEHHRQAALTHNTKGKIPLHYAAREGRIKMVNFMLHLVPQCADVLTKKGKIALHFAAGEGHLDVVRALLKVNPLGATVPSKKGKLALHFAARWGHIQIAKELCEVFPQCVHALDYDGLHPLHDAAREGQLDMAQFLVERYPQAMCKANLRGEVPLFIAIRSGNIGLVSFLAQSWPQGGKQVLQAVRREDNIWEWDPAILDMCLRGAVENFSDMEQLQEVDALLSGFRAYNFDLPSSRHSNSTGGRDPDSHRSSKGTKDPVGVSALSSATALSVAPAPEVRAPRRMTTPGLDISLPRSKSPILDGEECSKKRQASDRMSYKIKKRPRRGSFEEDEDCWFRSLVVRPFYQLHAALECSASVPVLECVLGRHGDEQLTQTDDLGKLPLHIAVEHCRSDGSVDFLLERILSPTIQRDDQACHRRDYLGRLALHLALMSRASCRLIEFLLEANPSSGVEYCETVDARFVDKLPIHMAMAHDCDLSTIFLLLRGDPTVVQSWNAFSF